MNIKKSYDIFRRINFLVFWVLMLVMASCRKTEFMPPAEGAIVPAEEATLNLKEILNTSTYTLFKAAWTRSTMDAKLKTFGERAKFTLFVPTDAAFIADGMTLAVINNTSPEALDDLLMYHTVGSSVNVRALGERVDNTIEKSILLNPNLRVKPISLDNLYGSEPYYYRQYLKVQKGNLYINGKDAGKISPIPATNGLFWPIDRLLHKPTKTMLEVLEEDGRFGIYLDVHKRCSDYYLEITEGALDRPWTSGLEVEEQGDFYPNITFNSVLAPTDAAFRAAGFADGAAVMEMNMKHDLPIVDWDRGIVTGLFASDYMLTYHRWSDRIYPKNASNGSVGRPNSTAFYSNDFNNEVLANYVLRDNGGTASSTLPLLMMPMEFGTTANGAVTIKAKGSTHPPAVIVEGDINTIMGPIHVVDHLIPTADFKF